MATKRKPPEWFRHNEKLGESAIKQYDTWRSRFDMLPNYDVVATKDEEDFFNAEQADHVCGFFPACLEHVKGDKSRTPFILEEWQKGVIGCLFGWQHHNPKLGKDVRRFRECFFYVAKKNGKTALGAGILLYMLWVDSEYGAELYSAAASKDQAALVFEHAAGMVRINKRMQEDLRVYGARGGSLTRSIVYEEASCSYKCVSADADTLDGCNPHAAIVDELHRHKSGELSDILQKSTAARSQSIILYMTTADYNRESACNTKLKYAHDVIKGAAIDPSFLPVVFETQRGEDWEDPAVWRKANPNMDVTVPEDFLRRECEKAKSSPPDLNNFLRLHLNMMTDADVAFLDMHSYDKCTKDFILESLEGEMCFGGIDLASTKDIAAFVLWFPVQKIVLMWCWLPQKAAIDREKKQNIPYSAWAREGLIEITPGNTCDYDLIRKRVNEAGQKYNIVQIAFDAWNSHQLQGQLGEKDGFEVVKFRQGFASMTAPTKELERMIIDGECNHGGNKVLRWMAGNCMVEDDAAGNIKLSKKKSTEKIDGMIAWVMAIGIALQAMDDGLSCYESEGLSVI